MSTLKNGEFGIDWTKEKILWTDRKRHTIFSAAVVLYEVHPDRGPKPRHPAWLL